MSHHQKFQLTCLHRVYLHNNSKPHNYGCTDPHDYNLRPSDQHGHWSKYFFKQMKWQLLSQYKKISLRQWHLRNVEFITSSIHLPRANSTNSWPSLHVFSAFVLTWNILKIYLLVLSLLGSSHKQNGMDTKLSLISTLYGLARQNS